MTVSLNRRTAIVGVAESDLGRTPGKTALQLQAQAAQRAMVDAGVKPKDIDAVFAHMPDRFSSMAVAEYLRIRPRFTDTTNTGGPSNLSHVLHAALAIEAGLCDVALITYGSTQASDRSRSLGGLPDDPRNPRGQFEIPFGHLTPIGSYALAATRHMHLYGTRPEQLAEVAVAARRWAALNPRAYKRDPLTVEEVLASPMIATPLRVLDCCLVTDGGGAVIVTSAERARSFAKPPVCVLGAAEGHSHHFSINELEEITVTNAIHTGRRAFDMAGVTPADIDVAEIYDSFTITVIMTLEDLGFCAKGEGGDFVSRGRIAPGGEFPLNTSGGGLSYCHPGMFGIFLLIEAVRQLRGECGERQVSGARLALCHGTGTTFGAQGTIILGRD